jgi:ketosteroid isomerase-like protein
LGGAAQELQHGSRELALETAECLPTGLALGLLAGQVVAGAGVIAALGDGDPVPRRARLRDTGWAMSQENVDVARRAMDAWNRGDIEGWLESGHPDIEWTSGIATEVSGTEQVYRGEVEMRRFWDEWHSLWDLTVEIWDIRDLGDRVVTIGRIQTHGKTSGIDLERPVAYVFEFEGGLIRKLRAYADPGEALEAVGLQK